MWDFESLLELYVTEKFPHDRVEIIKVCIGCGFTEQKYMKRCSVEIGLDLLEAVIGRRWEYPSLFISGHFEPVSFDKIAGFSNHYLFTVDVGIFSIENALLLYNKPISILHLKAKDLSKLTEKNVATIGDILLRLRPNILASPFTGYQIKPYELRAVDAIDEFLRES